MPAHAQPQTSGLCIAGAGQRPPVIDVHMHAIATPPDAIMAELDTHNVVAVVEGSDPRLANTYVAFGAHYDHVGYGEGELAGGSDSQRRPASPGGITKGAEQDRIWNGADDDGSGVTALMALARAFAQGPRTKRSLLFVWHTGEEAGLYGSEYYTDHPTVPRDSIVAQLNMDMVGRGAATDITGEKKEGGVTYGGPGYVQLVGSRRLSTELGDLIEDVNKTNKLGLAFDYAIDANGHPQNIYCRSDHYEYARYGIPVVFFTTGGHADYHQVTDEPQYIDYARMAQIATLVHDSAIRIANLDHRIVVDKPKPDPTGRCVQ